jgi:hypothetical protein
MLDETVCKNIMIQNPTSKPLTYYIKLEGIQDFNIDSDNVTVPAKQTGNYPVKFHARISRPVFARITFKSKKENGPMAAPLVFDLRSKVTGRHSVERIEIKSNRLYESGATEIKVVNPYPTEVEFSIVLENLRAMTDVGNKFKRTNRNEGKGVEDILKDMGKMGSDVPAFFLLQDKVRIRRKGFTKIKLMYLPVTFEVHRCHLIFCDDNVGELQYEVIGIPQYPTSIDTIRINTYIDSTNALPIPVSLSNNQIQTAYFKLGELSKGIKDEKLKENLLKFVTRVKTSEVFHLEISPSGNIGCPPTFNVVDDNPELSDDDLPPPGGKAADKKALAVSDDPNVVKLSLNFRNPVKEYSATVIMKNDDKTDLRMYELLITILPKVFKATIQMKTPARMPLEQNIPLSNPTDKEAKIKINFQNLKGDHSFQCPNQLSIRPNGTSYLPVKFNPIWKGEFSAKILLNNPLSNEAFEYDIQGVGEDPLAENHIKLKLAVDEEKKVTLSVRNYGDRMATFKPKIEMHGCSGEKKVTIAGNSTEKYELLVRPTLGGIYAGCVTFTDEEGRYIWYTLELESHGAKHFKTMELSSYVRKTQMYEIDLSNRLEESVVYDVVVLGEGLNGKATVNIASLQNIKYELYFSPMRIFSGKGTISFSNARLGEIFYELKLNAEDQPAVKLSLMKSELGKSVNKTIVLENPLNKNVPLVAKISKPDNFDILNERMELPAGGSLPIVVRYTPSEIDFQDTCEIVFETKDVGNWKYLLFGSGDPPTSFEELVLMGSLHKEDSGIINFANPFKTNIMINISIKRDEYSTDVIDIIQKKPKVNVAPSATHQIPFTFYPKEIRDYKAEIIVELNEKISWTYPIKVVTESRSLNIDFTFSTSCRKKFEKEIELYLPGLTDVSSKETYHAEINPLSTEYNSVLRKWLVLVPMKNYLNSSEDCLIYTVKYTPQKPFKAGAEIIITRANGGRWKFRVMTTSLEPEIDDTIVITSPLNVTSSVQFKLTNSSQKYSSDFTAEFSHDSASELTVFPRSGKLEPVVR